MSRLRSGMECPQGCSDTDPMGRRMERREERTGEYRYVEIPGYSVQRIAAVRTYHECPVCGWVIDA